MGLFLFFSSVSWSPFLGTGSYLVVPSPCTADLRANCLDKEQICVCVIKMGLQYRRPLLLAHKSWLPYLMENANALNRKMLNVRIRIHCQIEATNMYRR